ncbi:MAG: hypothetical protein DME33_07215 [Verrucomicrobia bacterium]|nr:MAG: hypothetical protein DME33_07215 [Verrucomicrobiota bacterium]
MGGVIRVTWSSDARRSAKSAIGEGAIAPAAAGRDACAPRTDADFVDARSGLHFEAISDRRDVISRCRLCGWLDIARLRAK